MKALVVGGGIGGLACGIALALRGWRVSVLEQAPALIEIGAGLQISPNGFKVLQALGVTKGMQATLFEPEAMEMRMGRSGRSVFRLPLKGYAKNRWGAPFIHIHRADLVAALQTRLLDLQADAIETGCHVESYTQTADSATLTLADGSTRAGDIAIGADGLHSVIRAQMLGPDQPRYTGNIAWRAVVPVTALGDHVPPPSACVWVGDKQHAVTTRLRAGTLVNFVGMVETEERARESWDATGKKTQAQADFAEWAPEIYTVIAKAQTLHRWALFDRAPLPRWHDGRVALLGDAAHPMLPSMAQGAVQALEDAWVLAAKLAQENMPDAAFSTYFDERIARTARVQKGSATNAALFHKATTLGALAFYGPVGIAARLRPDAFHARQDWVYHCDVTASG
ncbi:MAG: FAD-dependent monooxygenase [Tateyamaria sp.]|uniref:FAD-dependent monooxygenase n=1 Tax=Tateyamaria sp. TaxID=1929288 RepID=UPI003272068D